MAYPNKLLGDYERAFENGRDVEPPGIPMPPSANPPSATGGAPRLQGLEATGELPSAKLPDLFPATPRQPQRSLGEVAAYQRQQRALQRPTPGEGPYWMRLEPPEAPTRHTLYPAIPWDRAEVEKQYAPLIKQMGDTLWERYQKLPAEQKALPAWQQVAQNPQQAAYTVVARALANKANIRSEMNPEGARRTQGSELFRWLHTLERG